MACCTTTRPLARLRHISLSNRRPRQLTVRCHKRLWGGGREHRPQMLATPNFCDFIWWPRGTDGGQTLKEFSAGTPPPWLLPLFTRHDWNRSSTEECDDANGQDSFFQPSRSTASRGESTASSSLHKWLSCGDWPQRTDQCRKIRTGPNVLGVPCDEVE